MSDAQNPQTANENQPAPAPIDPAAAAFEMLREEVALTRRAVAGLAAERAAIDIPDYSETLAKILQVNATTAKRLKTLSEAPALQMSASNWGREIATAAENARRADQHAFSQARAAFQDTTENLRSWLRSARDAHRQNTLLIAAGAAGFVMGMALCALLTAWLIQPTSSNPHSPERQAAAILGLSEEKAGEHLIQTASPKLWQDLVLGDRIVIANRETLSRCLQLTQEHRRKAERCMIDLTADPQKR